MKRVYILISILISTFLNLNASLPNWVKTPPVSEFPNEYKYAVAVGQGRSENEAMLDAEEHMVEQVFKAHGCQNFEIESWQAQGYRVRMEQGRTYVSRDKEGTYRYYMLYIYDPSKSNYYNQKNWNCKIIGKEKSDIAPYHTHTTKPSYWSNYENIGEYISVQKFHKFNKGEIFQNVIDSLLILAQRDLISKYSDYGAKELFPPLVCEDFFYDKKRKEIHVINFVKKSNLKNLYVNLISESLTITIENEFKDAQSYENLEDWLMAKAMYEKILEQCNETTRRISQLKKIVNDSPLTDYYTSEINIVREKLRESMTKLRKKTTPDLDKQLLGLLDIAQKSEKERKLGTVLKYYYGALALINRYPQLGELTFKYDYAAIGRPWNVNNSNNYGEYTIKNWLPEHIKKILKEIDIYCYRNKTDVARQNLIFLWPDKTPVTNGDFCFNINKGEGWSWLSAIDDGKGEVEKRDCPNKFDIRLEYKYVDQWHSDEIIRNEVKNASIDFSREATHHVEISNEIPAYANLTDNDVIASSTDTKTEETNSKHEEHIKRVPLSDEKEYRNIIDNVCNAIKTQEYISVQNLFTKNGFELFLNLVKSGKVTVKEAKQYDLISCWDEVYARSIRMTIQYNSKKNILIKNVVFVFKDKKIDGIQFALDKITRNDINAQSEWDDGLKFAVMNFIENYQTAYDLKRLDYIESVFSDDAVIIVGTVVPEKTEMSDKEGINFKYAKSQKVKYYNLSKDEYLKRLKRIFGTNEWININFANVDISQHPDTGAKSVYGLGLRQDYSSQHYGDTGYLFLVVDMHDQQKPIIHLRVWTPEAEFGWPQYLQLLKEEQKAK